MIVTEQRPWLRSPRMSADYSRRGVSTPSVESLLLGTVSARRPGWALGSRPSVCAKKVGMPARLVDRPDDDSNPFSARAARAARCRSEQWKLDSSGGRRGRRAVRKGGRRGEGRGCAEREEEREREVERLSVVCWLEVVDDEGADDGWEMNVRDQSTDPCRPPFRILSHWYWLLATSWEGGSGGPVLGFSDLL